jgi:hypothetical protein
VTRRFLWNQSGRMASQRQNAKFSSALEPEPSPAQRSAGAGGGAAAVPAAQGNSFRETDPLIERRQCQSLDTLSSGGRQFHRAF